MNIEEIHTFGLDSKNRIIYLNGEDLVDEQEPGVDYRMSSKFIKNLNILQFNSNDPIFIHMNTMGGEWSYGMAIFDALNASPCHITIIAYSWARSMSSIILQAADHRILMPNSSFMVHWGTTSEDGHYLAVKSSIEFTAKTEKTMLDIYAKKCLNGNYFKNKNMTYQQVCDFITEKIEKKSDWWLTSEEAVDFGFADCVGV